MGPYNGFSPAQRAKAQRWLTAEVAAGRLAWPTSCAACGSSDGRIDLHAEDYSEPFGPHIGRFPLCSRCHYQIHRRFSAPQAFETYCAELQARARSDGAATKLPGGADSSLLTRIAAGEFLPSSPITSGAAQAAVEETVVGNARSGNRGPRDTTPDARAEAFRAWLGKEVARLPMTLNAVEASAGIRGNALGKFLRGERGNQRGLTPLQIMRLAPVLRISEERLLARSGHLTNLSTSVSVETAVLADPALAYDDKLFLLGFYARLVAARPSRTES